jgi:hypothetical protein
MKKKNPAVKTLLVHNQVRNIISVYRQAFDHEVEAGTRWYKEAREFCEQLADKSNGKVHWTTVAAIVAVLSPGVTWDRNKLDAEDLILKYLTKGKKVNPYRYATYPVNVSKAEDIYATDPAYESYYNIIKGKAGFKTASFFTNILGDLSVVTVDRHAYKVANNIYEGGAVPMHAKRYRDTASAYVKAAEILDIPPAIVQAVTWVTYRRLSGLVKQQEELAEETYVEPF